MPVVQEETFAPILYLIQYETIDEAIRYHNGVPQGLSSAIFTNDLREAEDVPQPQGIGLRHRQREHRHLGRGDRRRLRRGERDRGRPGVGLRLLEGVHAPPDLHHKLVEGASSSQGISFDVIM